MEKNAATLEFVRIHRKDDVRQLAFLGDKHPEVDMPWALDQIRGRQMAEAKIPSWAARDGIIYPPHLSMEQCSSEATALYKRRVLERWPNKRSLVDLTGGFGVDFSFLAPLFDEAVYVERLPHLCSSATHNFQMLNLHATVINGDSIDVLREMKPATAVFIDPARRDAQGRKTYSIKDCTPDVAALCPLLLSKCEYLLIKLSPMLDWHEAVRELQGVREVHIVSVGGECKELLLVCTHEAGPLRVFCANDDQLFSFEEGGTAVAAPSSPRPQKSPTMQEGTVLLVPNASIQKAGCFAELAAAFSLQALAPNSHLFLPTEETDETALFEHFPGRLFRIIAVSTLNKKELKAALAGIDRANIAVRNFPLTAEQLRKRLKLKDGGDVFIFGTTTSAREHIIIISKKQR